MTNTPEDQNKSSIFNSITNWIKAKQEPDKALLYTVIIVVLILILSVFLVFLSVILCAWLVIDAAFHISSYLGQFLTIASLIGLVIATYGWYRHKGLLLSFWSSQKLIPILAFIQTIFWVVDSQNSIHEPRSVLLLAISVALKHYDQELTNFNDQLNSIVEDINKRLKEKYPSATAKTHDP